MTETAAENVIEMRGVTTRFGDHVVHENLDFEVRRGEIIAVVGGSGSGKSTLLREIILLQKPAAGSIRVLGEDILGISEAAALDLRRRWGVMFQSGGLFGSLNVLENIGLPLREHTALSDGLIDEIAALKLALTGLEADAALKLPSELSGGMLKRAALARALALDPELLFLDEPTAGLDPASADGVDQLVLQMRDTFGLTVVVITHDLDLLWSITDRVAMLGEHKVLAVGTMEELSKSELPAVREYFEGARAAAARRRAEHEAVPEPAAAAHRRGREPEEAWKPR
ncbi:MAG TPA: ATP-binding cassette domain-containing protein [Burkholderiales bacterium]|nr:ATP-binding cassette domain-containing protein [Burkholderiales bacterium]